MAITGPSSYIPTINEFLSHWLACNTALPPASPFLLQLPATNTTIPRSQFVTLRDSLQAQQGVVQGCLTDQQVARGTINLQKADLLARFGQFMARLDAYYRHTDFYAARPHTPSIGDGQENFTRPMVAVIKLWEKLNAGPAPAGLTLPLTLVPGGMGVGEFASAVSALQFAYAAEQDKEQAVTIARAKRDRIQDEAYAIMMAYRENLPGSAVAQFPELVGTLPRLSPLPGHTPEPVNASAIFEAPDRSRVVYEASTDAQLDRYELRGNVGDDYSAEDAVVIATRGPNDPREFVVPFGLNQPGAEVALKLYVILTTGNEAGSAAMFVERPLSLPLAA
jgi:hypothetical protein